MVRRSVAERTVDTVRSGGGAAVDNGAGVVLAFVAWCWLLGPLISGGPDKMKRTLKAKFFNQYGDTRIFPGGTPVNRWLP